MCWRTEFGRWNAALFLLLQRSAKAELKWTDRWPGMVLLAEDRCFADCFIPLFA
jgi:hypothetical protein